MRSGITVRSSGVARSTESLTGASGGISSVFDGRYSSSSATAPSTSSDSTEHSPLAVACTARPPSSSIPISIPVNSATICGTGHEGHRIGAHDDEVGEPEQESRPGDDGSGRHRDHRHLPATARDRGRRQAPAVQRRDAVEDVGTTRGHEEHERDPEVARLVGRLGKPDPVGMW